MALDPRPRDCLVGQRQISIPKQRKVSSIQTGPRNRFSNREDVDSDKCLRWCRRTHSIILERSLWIEGVEDLHTDRTSSIAYWVTQPLCQYCKRAYVGMITDSIPEENRYI